VYKHKLESKEYIENWDAINDVLMRNAVVQLGRGAEIGIRHGVFSEHILSANQGLTLYLVDPYQAYQDVFEYYNQARQDEIKEQARTTLTVFGNRAAWIYESSLDAAAGMADDHLDFVFIDAEHSYRSVKADIYAWHSKVRIDGLLSGHDYHMDGVRRAVDGFAEERGLTVQHIGFPAHVWLIQMLEGK
jgi:hypothetical protein